MKSAPLFIAAARPLTENLLPDPEHHYGTNHAEHEVGEIALAQQFDVQQVADECACITAHDPHDEVHAAALAFAAHDAVGHIADDDTCQYRPSREFRNLFAAKVQKVFVTAADFMKKNEWAKEGVNLVLHFSPLFVWKYRNNCLSLHSDNGMKI